MNHLRISLRAYKEVEDLDAFLVGIGSSRSNKQLSPQFQSNGNRQNMLASYTTPIKLIKNIKLQYSRLQNPHA